VTEFIGGLYLYIQSTPILITGSLLVLLILTAAFYRKRNWYLVFAMPLVTYGVAWFLFGAVAAVALLAAIISPAVEEWRLNESMFCPLFVWAAFIIGVILSIYRLILALRKE